MLSARFEEKGSLSSGKQLSSNLLRLTPVLRVCALQTFAVTGSARKSFFSQVSPFHSSCEPLKAERPFIFTLFEVARGQLLAHQHQKSSFEPPKWPSLEQSTNSCSARCSILKVSQHPAERYCWLITHWFYGWVVAYTGLLWVSNEETKKVD